MPEILLFYINYSNLDMPYTYLETTYIYLEIIHSFKTGDHIRVASGACGIFMTG